MYCSFKKGMSLAYLHVELQRKVKDGKGEEPVVPIAAYVDFILRGRST